MSGKKTLRRALLINLIMTSLSIAPSPLSILSYVQAQEKVRSLPSEFVGEPGCPVSVSQARTELDLDPFGAPLDARIYIDYTNVSSQPVDAVKFRIRFVDQQGNDRGTFHAPDAFPAGPGAQRSQKWKYEKIDPRTVAAKVRVLQVRYSGGSTWQSVRLQELPTPPGQDPVMPGAQSFPDSGSQSDKPQTAQP